MTDPNSSPSQPTTTTPESQNGKAASPFAVPPSSREPNLATMPRSLLLNPQQQGLNTASPVGWILLGAIALLIVGISWNNPWLGIAGILIAGFISLRILWIGVRPVINELVSARERLILLALLGMTISIIGLLKFTGTSDRLGRWLSQQQWDELGSLAEWTGAVGQIFIAVLAVYVAWRQYIISRDLTIQQNSLTVQQNLITQQQTIDSYFQGISDLVLDEEGLLEDWPQERLLAEGRTAAILSSVDASGKAKILRFLSTSKLLTPLERDRRLGRAIFDGLGGYAEDRANDIRVIDLGVMLAKADLSQTDLRRTDLSDANLVGANLKNCDLVKANLSRSILYDSDLTGADLKATRLFYGSAQTASPRGHTALIKPDYQTGAFTGAVVENADFTDVQGLSEEQRYYCCAWGGEKTRGTIPGGCEGIPNKLGR